MIGLTTGRQTSQRLNSLLRDLAQSIPRAKIMRRGKLSLDELGTRLLDEGLNYALALYRWHCGPGRIDFFEARLGGITQVAPSIILRSVKLRREYGHRGRSTVEGVTYDPNTTKLTQDFSRVLSRALDLPEPSPPISTQLQSTLHISEKPAKSIQLVVTSPPAERTLGQSWWYQGSSGIWMTRAKTPKACAILQISFRSRRKMRAVVEAFKPELTHPAGDKARAAITVRGNMLNLRFEAKDAATLRAIFSSYVRMLAATLNVCEIIHQLETPDAVKESDKG